MYRGSFVFSRAPARTQCGTEAVSTSSRALAVASAEHGFETGSREAALSNTVMTRSVSVLVLNGRIMLLCMSLLV